MFGASAESIPDRLLVCYSSDLQRLVHIRGSKRLSHGRILSPNTLWKSCYVWCFCRIYSRQTPSMLFFRSAAPGSHPRIEKTFPWPHLNPQHPLEKLLCLVLLQNLFPTDS